MPDVAVTIRRGFPPERASALWRWLNTPRSPNFDDFGPKTTHEFAVELAQRLKYELTWAIESDGEIVGYAGAVRISPVTAQFHGIVIAPDHRRNGIGPQAVQLIWDELRADGVTKMLAYIFADNSDVAHMFTSLGWRREGLLPGMTRRGGMPLASLIFGMEAT